MLLESGIFLINKPTGITSSTLIKKIQNKMKIKKIGHAGTLDPLATGLMLVLVNQATKISDFLLSNDKKYEVVIQLFKKTDSGDITGEIIKEEEPTKISKTLLKEIVEKYNGYIYDQYPPIYSAIKIKGKKLYEYARSNNTDKIEIKPRQVTIRSCVLNEYNHKNNTISLTVECSKGTYIRSLAEDIATDLNTIATIKELNRTKSGEFELVNAKTIEEVKPEDICNIYDALLTNKQTLIEYHLESDIKQGKPISLLGQTDPIIFILNDKKEVIAIYRHVAKDIYACQRGLWSEEAIGNKTEAERSDEHGDM